jgi:hypothetical protein
MKYIRSCLLTFCALTSAGISSAQPLGASDVGNVVSAYRENEARFAAKFRGKEFASEVQFAGATENMFSKGRFMGKFAVGGKEVNCWIERKADVDRLIDLNRGDKIMLTGTISDVIMGDLQLKPCTFKKI